MSFTVKHYIIGGSIGVAVLLVLIILIVVGIRVYHTRKRYVTSGGQHVPKGTCSKALLSRLFDP